MSEWSRVADKVFVIVPSWFSPHTWFDPTHRWVIDPTLKMAAPLWTGRRCVYLLKVSDSGYGMRPWNPTTSKTSSSKTSSSGRPLSKTSQRSVRSPSPKSDRSRSQDQRSSPYGAPLSTPSQRFVPPDSSGPPVPDLRTHHSESSNSASHLMVVSTHDLEESW
jgi:hypothetical protein